MRKGCKEQACEAMRGSLRAWQAEPIGPIVHRTGSPNRWMSRWTRPMLGPTSVVHLEESSAAAVHKVVSDRVGRGRDWFLLMDWVRLGASGANDAVGSAPRSGKGRVRGRRGWKSRENLRASMESDRVRVRVAGENTHSLDGLGRFLGMPKPSTA